MEQNPADIMLVERRQEAQERNAHGDIREHRSVYRTRLVLRFLSLATCVSISALLTLAIRQYFQTKDARNPFHDGSGTFPVWPEGLKLYPSYALLGAAVVAGLLSLLLVIASFHKNVRRMTKTGNITTIIISVICLVVWIAVTAYYGSWDTQKTNWDLLSWSCTHQDPRYDYQNIDFSEMCTEMRFAFWAGVGLAGMEAGNLLVFVIWWFKTRRSHGYKNLQGGKDSNNFAAAVGGMFS
ncbi:hypothetical protein IQ06DRAFT_272680 [Phaeosphaeriaceae sp. SRC1lsM3a]|nr:hypothetical protein IQ06DRAFT_272680 [Stagonospora sp. SRC1lsM3a]